MTELIYSKYDNLFIPYQQNLSDFILKGHNPNIKNGINHSIRAFVDDLTGETISHTQLRKEVNLLASGLVNNLRLKRNDVIAIFSPNHINYATIFLAACSVGIIVTTINPAYTETEVLHQIKDSNAKIMFTIEDQIGVLKKVNQKLNQSIQLINMDKRETKELVNFESIFSKSFCESLKFQNEEECKEQIALIAYSSGTTGKPKGVMTSHFNEIANIMQNEVALDEFKSMGRVVLGLLPFFHCYGIQILLLTAIHSFETVIVIKKFELKKLLQSIQTHKITSLFLAPPVILALAKDPIVDNYDLTSVEFIFSGAAPLPIEVSNLAGTRFKCHMFQGYGMTEASPCVSVVTLSTGSNESVGSLVPNMAAKIVSLETGKTLPIGEIGELWVKGPNIMIGYLNNPEATKAMFDSNGFMRTGDVGYFDKQYRLYIVDRAKELIKYRGFQVAPAELEALLLAQPQVTDCCVIGVPNDEAGEVPKAFIVLKPSLTDPGNPISYDALIEQIKIKVHHDLAYYKHLRGGIKIVDHIPKSPSGKILRRLIRDKELSKINKSKL
ncbi:acetyl-CoA synthetase-like protein [Neoconidiobolus thromboides FSU 785]|nr:acetyl-CoA synthetase-like protein [Neoconidiobolus thromboides FSU 785]